MKKIKQEDPKIIIDNKEYVIDELSDKAKTLVNHIADLKRKLSSYNFNIEQLKVGLAGFENLLKQELEEN
jgi:predicted RNase H-like nuclease (RuvC/YqgF family)|tara:strand:+ start:132 stop:341 length:210 start_codon:yes stop_codon:yes gene_type:complete